MARPTCKAASGAAEALDIALMRDRFACLTSVTSFLEGSDPAGIQLLHDLCLEMAPMTPDTYRDSLYQADKILRRFAEEHRVTYEVQKSDTPKEAGSYALTAEVLERLPKGDREFLDRCLKITNEDSGFTSPAENFLNSLILLYSEHGLRPENVTEYLPEFRENLTESVAVARKMLRDYPDLVKP